MAVCSSISYKLQQYWHQGWACDCAWLEFVLRMSLCWSFAWEWMLLHYGWSVGPCSGVPNYSLWSTYHPRYADKTQPIEESPVARAIPESLLHLPRSPSRGSIGQGPAVWGSGTLQANPPPQGSRAPQHSIANTADLEQLWQMLLWMDMQLQVFNCNFS